MAKNKFLQVMQLEVQKRQRYAQFMNERQCLDTIIVTLNREFGFGADRINRFIDAYAKEKRFFADMFMNDRYVDNDKELAYAKEKSDRLLRSIMGEDYPAWDERYEVDITKLLFEGGIRVR